MIPARAVAGKNSRNAAVVDAIYSEKGKFFFGKAVCPFNYSLYSLQNNCLI
jgi:hypothetical protein